jgi:hypothetical protein
MSKRIGAYLFLVVAVVLIFQPQSVRAQSPQTIQLPLAARYVYNEGFPTPPSQHYGISQSCEGGDNPSETYHVGNAAYAVDFASSLTTGTPVYAPVSGSIVFAAYDQSGYGMLIKIKEDNIDRVHWLAHLSKFFVTDGHVSQGQLIALSGETGYGPAHLHYHVQTVGGTAIDVRGELPDINWIDPSDFCADGNYNGWAHPSQARFAGGANVNNCADFYNLGYSGVWGFDAPNCQGNVLFGPLGLGEYSLSAAANDRLRSISTPQDLNFWLYGHYENNSLQHCHSNDMWNLDVDSYNDSTVKIGWDTAYEKQTIGGGEKVSNGWNMVSRLLVTTNPCPANQNSRIQALEISYGLEVGGGGSINPNWLTTFSIAPQTPLEVDLHTQVDPEVGVYSAHRILVDGQSIGETSAAEQYITWNTFGWADGYHNLEVQYRRVSDDGNWGTALSYSEQFYLSPNRHGVTPCDGRDGVELSNGSDCVLITESFSTLDQIGWNDVSNLTVKANNFEAWVFDGGNYQDTLKVVKSGQTQGVGSNVSSIQLRTPPPPAPPVPTAPFAITGDTMKLFHFDEGSGNTTNEAIWATPVNLTGHQWVSGKFGSGLSFPNPPDGPTLKVSPFDTCQLTVDMWVKTASNSGRLAGQLSGGGNSGANKWLLMLDGGKPKFEIWSAGGSQWATGYISITDGNWHYLMATYDCGSKQARVYVDNVMVADFYSAASWNTGATTFEIGSAEGIYKCNCTIDEVRLSNTVHVPTAPSTVPTASVNIWMVDPAINLVAIEATWSNAAEDWHILDWKDGSDVGYFGSSGTSIGHPNGNTHDYDLEESTLGMYVTFRVKGLDGNIYEFNSNSIGMTANPICISSLDGVALYRYRSCSHIYNSDEVRFLNPGFFNLADYGMDNDATSVHVFEGMSVMLYEGSDGTGQSYCRWPEDIWDLGPFLWPDGTSMDNTISSIEVFANETCNQALAPTVTLEPRIDDPINGIVHIDAVWSNAANDWHLLEWGDGTSVGYNGSSGTSLFQAAGSTHDYDPGTYTIKFNVKGTDGQTYVTSTEPFVISAFGCGSAVSLAGVVLFDHTECAYTTGADHVQFMQPGFYNLADYGLDNAVSSVHFLAGTSVKFYEGPAGTGQSYCRWPEDMWDMSQDLWPDGTPMDNSVSSIEIFANETCSPGFPAKVSVFSPTLSSLGVANLSFTGVSAAEWYHIQLTGGPTQYDGWTKAENLGCISGGSTCSLSLNLKAGNYSYRVQSWGNGAYNENSSTVWSQWQVFSMPAPARVSEFSPVSVSYGIATVNFTGVAEATWYAIAINGGPTAYGVKWYSADELGCAGGGVICSLRLPKIEANQTVTHLVAGNYNYWIQSWGPAGYNEANSAAWSDKQTFSVAAPAKVTVFHPSIVANAHGVISWDGVEDATWYHVWLGSTPGPVKVWDKWYSAAELGCEQPPGPCTAAPSVSLYEGSYVYYVQSWGPSGYNESSSAVWSAAVNFTSPSP